MREAPGMKTAVVEFLRIDHSLGIAAGKTGQQRRGTTLGIRLPKGGSWMQSLHHLVPH